MLSVTYIRPLTTDSYSALTRPLKSEGLDKDWIPSLKIKSFKHDPLKNFIKSGLYPTLLGLLDLTLEKSNMTLKNDDYSSSAPFFIKTRKRKKKLESKGQQQPTKQTTFRPRSEVTRPGNGYGICIDFHCSRGWKKIWSE
jgi:hypothetical protein